MATNKSKRLDALSAHVLLYTLTFMIGIPVLMGHPAMMTYNQFCQFLLVTGGLHFITDAVTSRITSKLWFFRKSYSDDSNLWFQGGGNRHWFFVMIGFDQLLHYVMLAVAYHYYFGGF